MTGKEGTAMKSTVELEHQIRGGEDPQVLRDEEFSLPDLAQYLNGLLKGAGLTVQDVVVRCNLDRWYGYQLFNGTRRPSRNILLRLALLLGLSEGETQRLLKVAGRQPLYARCRWDAAVLYALSHGMDEEEAGRLLSDLGEEGLV